MARKENNRRRFPGESNKCRPDRATQRREEALVRQEKYNAMSTKEKLALLDIKFGPNQGAKKQRERLRALTKRSQKELEEITTTSLPDEIMLEIEAINQEASGKKKLKAKERRNKN